MSRRSRLLVAAIGVLLSDAALVAQDADAPSGLRLLRGVVVTGDDSRAPVRRVRVSATWTDGRSDPVFTDDRGRFEIAVPTSSSHTLSLTKAGFAPQQLFRARGLSPDAVEILMIRGAVITGTVLDPGGEPVVGLGVIVRRTDPSGDAYGSGEWTTETDDRGEFRVGSLPEGPFAVVLTNRRSSGAGWQSGIYLNGAVNRDTVVHAHAGQELAVSRVFEPPPAVGAVVVASLKVDDLRAALGGPAGGSIRGRVVGANGRPGAGVTVIASPLLDGRERTVSADAEGRYRIDLPPGAYRLIAGGSGANRFEVRDGTRRVITLYPDGMAAPDQLGRIVAVGDGERQEGIDLTVARGGVIAGTVTDEYGEPLEGLTIELWQARWTAGRTVVSRAAGIPARKADDRGYYRSYGLAPGSYYVVAIESPPKSEQQAPGPLRRVFHPAAPDLAEAIPVSIEPGRDALDVNLAFQPARLAQIRGRVSSGSGEVFQGSVRLVRLPLGAPSLESRSAEVAAGTFAFENVSPGEYTLDAASRQAPPDEVEAGASNRSPVERGTARVAVGPGESVDVAIHTVPTPGSSIDGRVVIKGEASRFPADFMVFAQPAEPAGGGSVGSGAFVGSDGSFRMLGVSGAVRLGVAPLPRGWRLESAAIGGVNAVDEPVTLGNGDARSDVEVVIAQGGAEISGHVLRQPAGTVSLVLVYPADPRLWFSGSRYFAMAAADRSGSFKAAGLPKGEYWVVAADAAGLDSNLGEWQNPERLTDMIPAASRVTVADGERVMVELRARPGR